MGIISVSLVFDIYNSINHHKDTCGTLSQGQRKGD